MRKPLLALSAALAIAVPAAPVHAEAAAAPVVLVLDASGSMWGQVDGEAKIVGARRVVGELAAGFPDDQELALVAYGHRREGDCADIETLLPLAALDRGRLGNAVGELNPRGKTPISAAIGQALGVAPPGATVLVVTDGLETCGGDPCATVRAAREAGGEFVLHVVGLDVAREDVSQLECAAQAGGGLYLAAADAAGLAAAMEAALAAPADAPAGALVVSARRNGELQDVAVQVRPRSAGPSIGARTYAHPETNPRRIPLADGVYDVEVSPVGIDGAAPATFELAIRDGAVVEKAFDYSTGTFSIGATRNGALSDVTYRIFPPGERRRPADAGRTYRSPGSNPALATLPAGTYDVQLVALEIAGDPEHWFEGVEIRPSGTTEIAHDFLSGEIAIGVVRSGELVDAAVQVRSGGKTVAAGRTYTSGSSNPKRFVVPAGTYEISIGEIRGENAKRTLEVAVEAGGETIRTIDLDAPGG